MRAGAFRACALCYGLRMDGSAPGSELERVGELLAQQPDLVLGFAFGSVAAGQADSESDIDIAVLAEHELDVNRTMQLIREITLATGRPVDLIDLRVAGPRIGQQVIRNGSELFVRSRTELAEFITRTIIDAADFLPIVDSAVKENLDTWTRE